MLRVTLLGNLGADPETRFTQKGTQVVSFNVAVSQARRGPDGERQESTEWFRIRVANRQSEFVQRLSKGSRVLVVGRLEIGHYQSREGEPRTSFDVWADDITALSPTRTWANEADAALDGEPEAPQPAVAGVSSLAAATPSRASASSNGKSTRTSPRPETASPEGTSSGSSTGSGEDLEDLPF